MKKEFFADLERVHTRIAQLEGKKRTDNRAKKEMPDYVELLWGILSSFRDTIIVGLDREGNHLFVWGHPDLERAYGIRPDQVVGKSLRDILPPHTAEERLADLKHVFETGQPVRAKHILPSPEGDFWHDVSLCPMRAPSGEVLMVVGFVRNITEQKQTEEELHEYHENLERLVEERAAKFKRVNKQLRMQIAERKQAEEKLREKEKRFRSLVETASDAIITGDGHGKITSWNKAAETIFGYSADEAVGKPIIFLMPARLKKKHQRILQQAIAANLQNSIRKKVETVGLRKDGSEFPLELSLTTWVAKDKTCITGILRDTTERKQAEAEIRELNSAVEQSIDGIAISDLEQNLTYVNPAFARMHGYSDGEMIGMKLARLHGEKELKELETSLDQVNKLGSWIGEIEHIKKDGTPFPTHMSVTSLRDVEGRPTGILAVARDITEQMRLEAQLLWSQKMEAVGRLAGGIAHDFNNMLTTIKGYAELGLMEIDPGNGMHDDLLEILKASERAARLTQQLLAFSRRQVIEPQVLNLNEVILDTDKMLRRLIGEDIELVTLLTEHLGSVKMDPSQIEQVLANLAVNARDAMPNGGKLIIETSNVTLHKGFPTQHMRVTPGEYVRLSVSDTGVGMTEEVKKHLFEPFFTTKEVGKGTGLGLATCYGILQQNGGSIAVDSEPNRGATFNVYVPRVGEEASSLLKRHQLESMPRGKEKVLVVEDEISVRQVATRVLRDLGYTVLEAENGDDALRVASENQNRRIHLLLTDVVMPQMGGKPLAERLRSERPDIRVLFFSGYADNALVQDGVLDSGVAFLQKPFSPAILAQKVREVLDAAQ